MKPSPPELLLDNQLCFLFHRISRDLTAAYRPLLTELGLTYPQYLVMLALWEQEGQTIGELGERLRLDSGTLSPLVRRLEQSGLVQRRREAQDERKVTVHLTAEGRFLRRRATKVPRELASWFGGDEQAYRSLHSQLTQIAEHLEAITRR